MKPSTAEKPAAKSTKPAVKSNPKVFDVARPGKSSASATSRPVIISNRPILQDPMVSTVDSAGTAPDMEATEKSNPSTVKVTIKPLAETDEPIESVDTSKSAKKDKTIAELAAEKSQPKSAEEPVDKPEAAPEESDKSADSEEAAKVEPGSDSKPADEPPASDTPDAETVPAEEGKTSQETAALEAEAKKLEAINALAESQQYFLPINAVERRRSLVVSILGLLLIVGLGALLVDLLLDIGFIRLGGIHSLTHFFSS
jgi:hypothetical protein